MERPTSDQLDAAATALTGIPLVRPFEIVPGGEVMETPEQWGEPEDWELLAREVQVSAVQVRNRRLIVARSAQKMEIPMNKWNHRPSANDVDDYEGAPPEENLADDELSVNLTDQNAVQAEAGTKAQLIVNLPGGESMDAFTVVQDAFHGVYDSLENVALPSGAGIILRKGLTSLMIEGAYNAKGDWVRENVMIIGKFSVSATECRNVNGYIDTTVHDTPHLVWITIPKGHKASKQGIVGMCLRFLPDSGDPAESKGKFYPRLDDTTLVGYRKFYSADDLQMDQIRVLRSLDAIHRATTQAARVERDVTGTDEERESDEDAAWNRL